MRVQYPKISEKNKTVLKEETACKISARATVFSGTSDKRDISVRLI
jgi:hypothetical protein